MTSAYMPDVRVEVAFTSGYATPASGRVWTDVSSFVELHESISITHGRTDERGTCDANTLSLSLDNSDGRFTAGLTSSPYYPNVKLGRPIRVTATPVGGLASVRFVGYVDAWPLEWVEGVGTYAVARVGASSRMARLGLSSPLSDIIDQEVAGESPLAHYPLSEPEGATTASDTSGNLAPWLNVFGSGPNVVFGSATGPGTDSLTAAQFTPYGKFLQAGNGILPDTTTACTLEAFASTNIGLGYFSVVNIGSTRDSTITLEIGIDGTQCGFALVRDGGPGVMLATGTTVINDGRTHHLAATVSGTTLQLYVDGVLEATDSDAAFVLPDVNRLRVGEINYADVPDWEKTGVVAHVAIYDSALTADRIAAHAGAGVDGFAGESAASRLIRYARYAGIPPAEQDIDAAAITPIQHIDTTDKTALALAHMVESTEGGVLFDARDNALTYVGRDSRYGTTAAFALNMALQQVEAGVRPALDRQGLINDVTTSTPEGASVRVVNQASMDDYGRSTPGDVEMLTTDPAQAESAAYWLVNQYGEPRARVPALTVDVLALPLATQTALLAATVGTRFAVNNWPAQVGSTYASGFFVEGYSEAFDPESHVIALNVSPAEIADVFILNDAVLGALDGPYPLAY